MPPKTKRTRKHTELTARQLDYSVNFRPQGVKSSDDVKPAVGVIGQDRAIEAIRTGLNMTSPGYNIFVTGSVGTGRTDATLHLLEQFTRAKEPKLPDICYVNNFKNEDCPRVLTFRAGQG
nr:AAA family ATPase [candidate division Zixibacteria bacterium]